jgi:hypothetical protein
MPQDASPPTGGPPIQQALGLAGGNRSLAARILGVTRQAIQQAVRDDTLLTSESTTVGLREASGPRSERRSPTPLR